MRISGTEALAQYVGDTGAFQHSTHRASGDNASTMCGRTDHHLSSAILSELLVRNSALHYRNLDEILLRIVNSLSDCFLYFLRFAQAMTYYAIAIAYNYECRKGECAAALCSFHYAVDGYYLFGKLQFATLNAV